MITFPSTRFSPPMTAAEATSPGPGESEKAKQVYVNQHLRLLASACYDEAGSPCRPLLVFMLLSVCEKMYTILKCSVSRDHNRILATLQ